MAKLNKIVIYINPENKEKPIYLAYESENGLQDVYNLDEQTQQEAQRLLKFVKEKKFLIQKKEIIYCYNNKNKKIEYLTNIKDINNFCFSGSNLEGLKALIRHIRFCAEKKEILAKVYAVCNGQTFCLNESIINRKKGLKTNFKISDFENYIFLLEEYKKAIEKNNQNKELKNN